MDSWSVPGMRSLQQNSSSSDPTNKYSLENIQRSIVVLCIDEPLPNVQDPRSEYGGSMLHGSGSKANSGNRWFDKTIQVRWI